MTFYWAIVIAAVAAWLAGAVWYMALGRLWTAALSTPQATAAGSRPPRDYLPYIYAFVAELVMAWMLAGLLIHMEPRIPATLKTGALSGIFCWVGFVLPSMLVNNSFARRDWRLMWIDGGHWLLVLALMGAILGSMI